MTFIRTVRGDIAPQELGVTYVILRRIHRGRFTGYDYGTGKLEPLGARELRAA